ncbi:MAG: copper resistance domain protein, partial [Gemmatimonadetes bacterium]|nr:copper resistance domain protein [Gemmatimonadota bacterium]
MQAEPLIHWPDPIFEFIGFLAQFLAVGSIGFRFAAIRGRFDGASGVSGETRPGEPISAERAFYSNAVARAASIGLSGAIVGALLFAQSLPASAERAHTTALGLLTTSLPVALQALLIGLGIVGFVLASGRR